MLAWNRAESLIADWAALPPLQRHVVWNHFTNLRLIFTCCHPALSPDTQVALTLREVCGLTTEEVARAFLLSTATMAQRIVRGKAKIRDAKIPYAVPALAELGGKSSLCMTS